MKIEIVPGVIWNDEDANNSEARQWIVENVLCEVPEYDVYRRPYRWERVTGSAAIVVVREYVSPESGSWAKKCDHIIVEHIKDMKHE